MDEDNDGKFPDNSPVLVRYPSSKQEEQGPSSQRMNSLSLWGLMALP